MKNELSMRCAVMTAFLAVFGTSGVALAVGEVEKNDPITSAQRVDVTSGSGQVNGVLGNRLLSDPVVSDLDFYSFDGQAGDVVTIDIDGGMKAAGSTERS